MFLLIRHNKGETYILMHLNTSHVLINPEKAGTKYIAS